MSVLNMWSVSTNLLCPVSHPLQTHCLSKSFLNATIVSATTTNPCSMFQAPSTLRAVKNTFKNVTLNEQINDTLLSHAPRVPWFSEKLCFAFNLGSTQVWPCVGAEKVTKVPSSPIYCLPLHLAAAPPRPASSPFALKLCPLSFDITTLGEKASDCLPYQCLHILYTSIMSPLSL